MYTNETPIVTDNQLYIALFANGTFATQGLPRSLDTGPMDVVQFGQTNELQKSFLAAKPVWQQMVLRNMKKIGALRNKGLISLQDRDYLRSILVPKQLIKVDLYEHEEYLLTEEPGVATMGIRTYEIVRIA